LSTRSTMLVPRNETQTVEFVASVLESSTVYSMIGTDLEGNIVLWNEGARRIYGYERDQVAGRENASILHTPEDVANGLPQELRSLSLTNGKWEGTIERCRKNGQRFTARVVMTPRLDDAGKSIGFLLISKDISVEQRLQVALESSNRNLKEQIEQRRKGEHELRETHEQLRRRAQELEQSAFDMKRLAAMSELLQSCDGLEEARLITQESLQKLYPCDAGIVYLIREFGGLVEAFASWNSSALTSKNIFEPRECWALRRVRPHVIEDLCTTSSKCSHLQDAKVGASICIPMMGQSQIFGLLHVVWLKRESAKDSFYSESRERLAVAMADTLALALSNIRLREKLREQTILDPLTRLYNRRYLEDSLSREVSRARRAGSKIGVIMIDIDNFKQFNDSFGHPTGDELLRALATYLKATVRPEDIPSRYGGEEFTLILPGASCEIVRERAESLRKGFREIRMDRVAGNNKIPAGTSLSLGVAVFPEHGTTMDQVLRSADEALYRAKRGGKDRVAVAAPVALLRAPERLLVS
jgi:diguanylate cyclase (GGDEF)-like protein/PAS domain S-box-containing protein